MSSARMTTTLGLSAATAGVAQRTNARQARSAMKSPSRSGDLRRGQSLGRPSMTLRENSGTASQAAW